MGAVVTVLCLFADEAMIRFFSSDPSVIAVGAEYLRIIGMGYAGIRDCVRERQHVSGDGQHVATTDRLVQPYPDRGHPCDSVVRVSAFELRWVWVSLNRRDIAASGDEPDALEARVPHSPGVLASPAFSVLTGDYSSLPFCYCFLLRRIWRGLSIAAIHSLQGDGMYPDVRTGSKVGAAVVGAISVAAMTAATLVGQYSMTVNRDRLANAQNEPQNWLMTEPATTPRPGIPSSRRSIARTSKT